MEKIEYLTIRIENPFEMLGFIVYLNSKGFTTNNLGNAKGIVHLCNLNRWLFIDLESKMVMKKNVEIRISAPIKYSIVLMI